MKSLQFIKVVTFKAKKDTVNTVCAILIASAIVSIIVLKIFNFI